jgi:hypothetical protein
VDLDLAIVAYLDEGFASVLQAGLVILPCRKARSLIQHVHGPALPRQFIPAFCDGHVLQGPERIGVGEIAGIAKQVGDDVALVVFEREQGRPRRDLLGPEQPLLEVMPAWRAFTIARFIALALEGCDPVLLLAPRGVSKQLKLCSFDVAIPIGVLDGGVERGEREALFDVAFGQAESLRNLIIRYIPSLLQELCERLILFKFVHRGARHILDQRGFHGVSVVSICRDRTGEQHVLSWHSLLFGHAASCKIAPPSGDDLKGGAAGPDQ